MFLASSGSWRYCLNFPHVASHLSPQNMPPGRHVIYIIEVSLSPGDAVGDQPEEFEGPLLVLGQVADAEVVELELARVPGGRNIP